MAEEKIIEKKTDQRKKLQETSILKRAIEEKGDTGDVVIERWEEKHKTDRLQRLKGEKYF